MQLDLSGDDCELLVEVLTSYMSELRFEVGNTDDRDYRDKLKAREILLKKIIEKLDETAGE